MNPQSIHPPTQQCPLAMRSAKASRTAALSRGVARAVKAGVTRPDCESALVGSKSLQ